MKIIPETGTFSCRTPGVLIVAYHPEFNLTPAYDQFALAAIAFEALAGERPFKTTRSVDSLSSIFFDELKTLAELDIAKAEQLDPVFGKALSPEPEDRYPTILDFAEALEKAAG